MAPHPDYLRGKLDARQLAEWDAFSRVEQFGAQHVEMLTAFICRTIEENTPGRKGEFSKLTRFMPSHKERIMTAEEIHAAIRGAT